MLNERQEKLFNLVVESYIKNAEPVGSRFLLSESGLDCGEATIRNELRALEEAGLLTHPHTSSGRIPTQKGYEYFLQKVNWEALKLSKKEENKLEESRKVYHDSEILVKFIAKMIAELSGQAVIVAFSPKKIYYTGLSNVFSQPEFRDFNRINQLSASFDHCEDILDEFLGKLENEPQCFVGANQPFGEVLSLVAGRTGKEDTQAIIMIGPARMDYRRNYSLIKKFIELI